MYNKVSMVKIKIKKEESSTRKGVKAARHFNLTLHLHLFHSQKNVVYVSIPDTFVFSFGVIFHIMIDIFSFYAPYDVHYMLIHYVCG